MKSETAVSWEIITGDCLDVLRTFNDASFDAVITDPPYAVSVAGSKHRGSPGHGTRILDFFKGDSDWPAMTEMVVAAAQECLRVLKPNGSMYWFVGHRMFGKLIELFESRGFSTRFVVWSKKCPVPPPPGAGWPSGAELCIYAYRPGRTWTFDPKSTPRSNVLEFDNYRHGQPGKVDHPTQKPTRLMDVLVRSCARDGDSVLDPFAGSGTTGVACVRTGVNYVGVEIEPRYAEIARRRIAEAADHLFAGVDGERMKTEPANRGGEG